MYNGECVPKCEVGFARNLETGLCEPIINPEEPEEPQEPIDECPAGYSKQINQITGDEECRLDMGFHSENLEFG